MRSPKADVTVVGAGIAGLTAALRLAEREYRVEIFELGEEIGGNLRISKVFPHMFLNWYNNFWQLAADLGLRRDQDFEPITGFKFLEKGKFPEFMEWTNLGSAKTVWDNLRSGVAPIPDLFLAAYAVLDLLSQRFDSTQILSRISVNDFLASRPYASNRMAQLHDDFLQTIWSLHSYLTSAASYQDFIKYSFRHPEPQLWRLRGDIDANLLNPLKARLAGLGCSINTQRMVSKVDLKNDRVASITVSYPDGTNETTVPVENLVLSVPPKWLAYLVMGEWSVAGVSPGKASQRAVTILPQLAQLRRLRTEPIPVVDVYFNKNIPNIPREYVALLGSLYDLTFAEIPSGQPNTTAIAVAASDFYALPEAIKRKPVGIEDVMNLDGHEILLELSAYLGFNPGTFWGDPDSDIDWGKTTFSDNTEHELFVDEVGCEQWCLEPSVDRIANIFFAGDFCKTSVSIATVEAAVMSGLNAASALWKKQPRGSKVEIYEPDAYPREAILILKTLLFPHAVAAKLWSLAYDAAESFGHSSKKSNNLADLLVAPYTRVTDCFLRAWSIYGQIFSAAKKG